MAILTNFTVGAIKEYLGETTAPAPAAEGEAAPKKRGRPKKAAPVLQTEGEQPEMILPEDA